MLKKIGTYTLHVHTCRVTVPDLKNGWTDCDQIWYTVRDRLVGGRAQVIGGTPAQFARARLTISLARSSPTKGVILVFIFVVRIVNHSMRLDERKTLV